MERIPQSSMFIKNILFYCNVLNKCLILYFRFIQDFGYTRMKAHNKTHLYFEQVSDDKKGEVIDSFYIIKDSHGAGLYDKLNAA